MNDIRTVLGLLSLGGAVLWGGLNLAYGTASGRDAVICVVVAAAGVALWRVHLGRTTAVAVPATALAGTAASLLAVTTGICCMYAYHSSRGYPFAWLHRNGSGQT